MRPEHLKAKLRDAIRDAELEASWQYRTLEVDDIIDAIWPIIESQIYLVIKNPFKKR